jgi:hypothetical protein
MLKDCYLCNIRKREICGLVGYYTASCGNYLQTFWDNVSVPSSRVKIPSSFLLGILTHEDGTDTLSRNGK